MCKVCDEIEVVCCLWIGYDVIGQLLCQCGDVVMLGLQVSWFEFWIEYVVQVVMGVVVQEQ